MKINNIGDFFKGNTLEYKFFYIGIFLLASVPFISVIFILISSIISTLRNKKSYFKDYGNIPFFFSGILIIFSCISNTFYHNTQYLSGYDTKLVWLGISNWIPYFWVFWSLQNFSEKSASRKKFFTILIAGSFPVIATGITQYFLKVYGPFTLFNGLITWYQRSLDTYEGMSGLFNNANYLGTWLTILWPFLLVLFMENRYKKNSYYFSLFLLLITLLCIILTYSRNALIGLLLGTIFICGYKVIKWFLTFLISFSILSYTSFLINPDNLLLEYSQRIIVFVYRLNSIGIENLSTFPRFKIWGSAINFISLKPIWGWGSASFPILYEAENNIYQGHSHNLALELFISFGIPAGLLIISTIFFIFIFSSKNIFNVKRFSIDPYNKAWLASSLVLLSSQMFDVQYFDVRIGLIFWILLGGLSNIIREDQKLI